MGWLSGWSYRRAITITEQSGNDLTDFQVKISLDSSNFDFSKANSDGSDVRFTSDDGTTLLSHWIEKWDSSGQEATIWVKVPSIPSNGSTTIYMYYGNSSASNESSLYDTFDESDDFEGSSNIFTLTSGAVIESTYANTGDHSLHLKRGTGQVEKAYYSFTTPSSGKIHQTLYLLIKGTCNGYILAYKDGSDSWIGPKISVGRPGETYAFSQDLYYHDGSSYVNIGVSLSYEVWYKLEVVIDLDSQKFDFYVNGDKKVEEGPFVSSMPTGAQVTHTIENHATESSSYSHDIYIDTYYKRTLFTEPSYSIGSEENYTPENEPLYLTDILHYLDALTRLSFRISLLDNFVIYDVLEAYLFQDVLDSFFDSIEYNVNNPFQESFILFDSFSYFLKASFTDTLTYSCKERLVWNTSFLDKEFFAPYGFDSIYYTVHIPIEDIFVFSDGLFYSLASDFSLTDVLSLPSDNIERLSILTSYKDLLNLKEILKTLLFLKSSSEISFFDRLILLYPNSLFDVFTLSDINSFLLLTKIYDIFSAPLENIELILSLEKRDIFALLDLFSFSTLIASLLEDTLSFIDVSIPFGKSEARLFFSLSPYPENLFYSLYSTSVKITGVDDILTAEDGIYIFDEERTTGELMFKFGDLNSSRLKRIDKIFANSPLNKATIYADGNSYSYEGNKWINCGKGLKGKELKVLLENLEDVEFVSFRLVELRRPK